MSDHNDLSLLLAELRSNGWSVALHADRQNADGVAGTIYLLTHHTGIWASGEGSTDFESLTVAASNAKARLNRSPNALIDALFALRNAAEEEGRDTKVPKNLLEAAYQEAWRLSVQTSVYQDEKRDEDYPAASFADYIIRLDRLLTGKSKQAAEMTARSQSHGLIDPIAFYSAEEYSLSDSSQSRIWADHEGSLRLSPDSTPEAREVWETIPARALRTQIEMLIRKAVTDYEAAGENGKGDF